ncbi:hypothetical protein MTR_0415s0050 [Medicago truncatula]|uniref:Uncharacterized protein n=1 Tax=Medicago truncatula TaxID=3880 RepID=A0A072TFI0_MEDTR|nr:hypothetical protein MTR_0415s0050 [Medicago truncatula]
MAVGNDNEKINKQFVVDSNTSSLFWRVLQNFHNSYQLLHEGYWCGSARPPFFCFYRMEANIDFLAIDITPSGPIYKRDQQKF